MTTGSDVYSFGVLLWSLYTGQQPYVTMAGQLKPNTLFPLFPRTAHPQYKSLAERCLQGDPHLRPSFAETYQTLVSFFNQELDAGDDEAVPLMPSASKSCLEGPPAAAADRPDFGTTSASGALPVPLRSEEGDEGPVFMIPMSGCESQAIGYCTSRGLLASCHLGRGPQGC